MALLDDNRKTEPKPRPGQDRSVRPVNPDWEGGKQPGTNLRKDNSSGRYARPTIDENYSRSAYEANILGPLGLGKDDDTSNSPEEEESYSEEEQNQAAAETANVIRNARASAKTQTVIDTARQARQLPKIKLPAKDAKARLTATRVTMTNATWVGYTWLFVQLPFAILSILCFGIVYALDEITKGEGGIINWLVSRAASVADAISTFIGIDFAEIALYLASGFYLIVVALGLITIMVIYFQYVAFGLRPTTGRGSGFKTGMLLLAIIGYCTPMLNILPFVAIWVLAVWMHPR